MFFYGINFSTHQPVINWHLLTRKAPRHVLMRTGSTLSNSAIMNEPYAMRRRDEVLLKEPSAIFRRLLRLVMANGIVSLPAYRLEMVLLAQACSG